MDLIVDVGVGLFVGFGVMLAATAIGIAYFGTREYSRQIGWEIALYVSTISLLFPLLMGVDSYLRWAVGCFVAIGVPASLGVREWHRPDSEWLCPRFEGQENPWR